MSAAPDVGADEATRWLREQFAAHAGPASVLGEGQWSRCFAFDLDGEALVVRVGRLAGDFAKDRLVARFAGPDLPSPSVRHLGPGPWPDTFACVSTRGFGEPLESLPPDGWTAVVPSLLRTMDAIRAVPLAADRTGWGAWRAVEDRADPVADHGSWRAFLLAVADDPPTHRTHGWRARLAAHPAAQRTFDAGLARLAEVASAADDAGVGPHLVHADLLNRNLLVGPDGVASVFDWGSSLVGDHLYDLAVCAFWASWYPALDAVDLPARAAEHHRAIGLDEPDRDARLLACQLHVGLEHLAYSAYLDDPSLAWITARTAALLG